MSEEASSQASSQDSGELDIAGILELFSILNDESGSCSSALLTALRPLLKEERRERVDRAIKLLKLADAAEVLKSSGMLENLI